MTTPLSVLWSSLQEVLPTDEWMGLQDIYKALSLRLKFDEGDLRPEVGSAKQRAWQRNTRKELLNRAASNDVVKNGTRPEYRLATTGAPRERGRTEQKQSAELSARARPTTQEPLPEEHAEPICVDLAEPPERYEAKVQRIVRNTEMVSKLKSLYNNTCQLCSTRLEIGNGAGYSEGHHLRPLGHPHDGPDIRNNVLVVCPNCHTLLDLAVIEVKASSLTLLGDHSVSEEALSYHNQMVIARGHERTRGT